MQSAGSTPAEPAPAADDDWLGQFKSFSAEEEPSAEDHSADQTEKAESQLFSRESDTGDDWLNFLKNNLEDQPEAPQPNDGSADDGSNLKDASENTEVNPFASNPQDSLNLGWLDLAKEAAQEPPQPIEPAAEDEELPLPDWLTAFDEQTAAEASEGSEAAPELSQPDREEAQEIPAPPDDASIPDWLTNLQSAIPSEAEEPEETLGSSSETAPDWLNAGDDAAPAEPEALAEGEIPAPPDDSVIPDWLTSFENTEKRTPPPDEALSTDWMSLSNEPPAEEPTPPAPFEINAELPEWMDQINPEDFQEPAAEDQSRVFSWDTPAAGEEGLSNELNQPLGEELPEITPADLNIPPFNGQALPDWLDETRPLEETGQPANLDDEKQAGIEPGEIPGWLQAMQPVAAASSQEKKLVSEDQIEAHGPLAGYQGVLPGEDLVTHYNKPPVYTSRLQVTEKQRSYADLLEGLIHQESTPTELAAEKKNASGILLRMFLSLALIALIGYFLFSGSTSAAYPSLYAPETVAFYHHIQTLTAPEGGAARVLVVMDYEAALSGELNALASGPIQDLLTSGARLTFLSDVPAGAALTENLLQSAAAEVSTYQAADQVVNLGYLPGGAASLASFASDPRQTIPVDIYTESAWSKPALQGITQLSDFNAVLLLTDNGDNLRAWIEQVSPALADTPVLVVSSAQSAPIVQPYVQSSQISGVIAGLPGAASYDQLMQRSGGVVRRYWDAYQAGLFLILIVILLGIVIQTMRRLSSDMRTSKKS